jgi:hypothetical protein
MDKYENCSQYLANEDRNCSDQCKQNCAKWYYEFELNTAILNPNASQFYPNYKLYYWQLNMKMNTVDYLILTETYTWTFELFIGALGGAIGIWLGLDFGVLAKLVFKPIMMLLRKLLSFKGWLSVSTSHIFLWWPSHDKLAGQTIFMPV